jgi:hypothetical protein
MTMFVTAGVELRFSNLDDWLTVHRITLVDLQLDAQNFYLFTYNTFPPRWYLHLVVVEGFVSSSNPES